MDNQTRAQQRSKATIEQLKAEIAGNPAIGDVKTFAGVMGKSYQTFRRYLNPADHPDYREMPTGLLFLCLETLNITPEDFFKQVQARIDRANR